MIKKTLSLSLCCACSVLWAEQAVYDDIFPMNYYHGAFIGLPNKPNESLYLHMPELNQHSIYLYSWVNPSYNRSSVDTANAPIGFMGYANQFELQEADIVLEKPLDTLQHEHMDFGFKINNLAGQDFRYTTMAGILSQQLYGQNNLYGYDIPEFYVNAYLPQLAQGTVFTLGRYLAPMDIESPIAIQNFLGSHSINFMSSAFTQFGLTMQMALSSMWSIFIGLHSGCDMAPWFTGARPTLQALIRWLSLSNNDSVYAGINSLNDGYYRNGHNNIQQFNLIWSHRFTPQFFLMTEVYYEYQKNGRLGGDCIFGPLEPYGGGSGCGPIIPGVSPSFSIQNYVVKKLSEHNFMTFRTDYFNDYKGQRTGFSTPYLSLSLGVTHAHGSYLKIRPEIRYSWAYNAPAFNMGSQKTQALAVIDFIVQT